MSSVRFDVRPLEEMTRRVPRYQFVLVVSPVGPWVENYARAARFGLCGCVEVVDIAVEEDLGPMSVGGTWLMSNDSINTTYGYECVAAGFEGPQQARDDLVQGLCFQSRELFVVPMDLLFPPEDVPDLVIEESLP